MIAEQVAGALAIVLEGVTRAAQRDGMPWAQDAGGVDTEHLHGGLVTALLRLVVVRYAEDRGLLPAQHPRYRRGLSLGGLYGALQAHQSARPGCLRGRTGAWKRLIRLFRAVHQGAQLGELVLPGRGGELFAPEPYPFLERWPTGRVPSIDDFTVHQLLRLVIEPDPGHPLCYRTLDVAELGRIYEVLMGYRIAAQAGALVVRPGAGRRRTGSHYTPRELSHEIVCRTLEPLLATLGPAPGAAALLSLRVCDPAMGSGAFLVAACQVLAERVVAAWLREGTAAAATWEVQLAARRQVARRCLYGVDINPMAVNLARISLWLDTHAGDEPFSFVDARLRHGDSLVGLSLAQIRCFHWAPERAQTGERAIAAALDRCWLPGARDDALERAGIIADALVGAFFAAPSPAQRERERQRRLARVRQWLSQPDAPIPGDLRALSRALRPTLPVFHWPLELAGVFAPDQPARAPLRQGAGMDAVIGNPPFVGGTAISTHLGDAYRDWLRVLHPGAHGNGDLCAHFVRRASALLGEHGTMGLIATNTIAQGDTRATALRPVVHAGARIYHATRTLRWPGDAAVTVSVVHLAKGQQAALPALACTLDGQPVQVINSRLRPRPERPDPVPLAENRARAYLGAKIYGQGFLLTPAQRQALIARDPRNGERIVPYIGGEEVNRHPRQEHHRYVICFGAMSLEEAAAWPELLAIVRATVQPERQRLKNNPDGRRRKQCWWQFGRWTPSLQAALASRPRCLVTARVSKHSILSFQPTDRIFSEQLYVFVFDDYSRFAVMQSRIHQAWAWLLSSSMKTDLRYAASDCFDTFPFPEAVHMASGSPLEAAGRALYQARAAWTQAHARGLTALYNLLGDPGSTDRELARLRRLHQRLDRAVLAAYGWADIPVPAFPAGAGREQRELEDEVLDRLFALNARRGPRPPG